ncbi:MAG: homoprotocatechuate degradation operon regulator HpaR [Eikenella sp.]|nr:homoprotocatechuate degradation operon regulator HpaR [Eikenella sp.]
MMSGFWLRQSVMPSRKAIRNRVKARLRTLPPLAGLPQQTEHFIKNRHYVSRQQPSAMSQEYRNLPMLLYKARESFMTQFRPILNEFGVTEQQWRIIRALAEQGDLEPRQLCEQCLILSPSMAGMLKRMEELGLIEKIPMADQRRIRIHLTDQARQLYTQAKERIAQEYQSIAGKIGQEPIANLYQALDIIIEELKPFQNPRT